MSKQSAWSIAYMRENFPIFRAALLSQQGLDMLALQGHKINWAWVNDVEETCGLSVTPMPNHAAVYWKEPESSSKPKPLPEVKPGGIDPAGHRKR